MVDLENINEVVCSNSNVTSDDEIPKVLRVKNDNDEHATVAEDYNQDNDSVNVSENARARGNLIKVDVDNTQRIVRKIADKTMRDLFSTLEFMVEVGGPIPTNEEVWSKGEKENGLGETEACQDQEGGR